MVAELVSLCLLSVALSMDAFSVSIGLGTLKLRRSQMVSIPLLIGVFHMGMPLAGIWIGQVMSVHLGRGASIIAGVVLLLLGIQMAIQSLSKHNGYKKAPRGLALFAFCFGVSVDSFSVGLSLGISGAHVFLSITLMGLFSACLTWFGLWLGHRLSAWLGPYSQVLGGVVLIVFGLKFVA